MEIGINILGTEEAVALFNELSTANQQKVIRAGFRKSGKIILDEARSNLEGNKKKTIKRRVEKSFRMEDMKDAKEEDLIGVQVGNTSYIARWLEYGTKERSTKGKRRFNRGFKKGQFHGTTIHSTGKMPAYHFLEKATETKGEEAANSIYSNIKDSFDRLITKYSKQKK